MGSCNNSRRCFASYTTLDKILQMSQETTPLLKRKDEESVSLKSEDNQCPICLSTYFKPSKIKICGHIFCLPCLQRLPTDGALNFKTCPLYRRKFLLWETVVKNDNATKIPMNDYLLGIHYELGGLTRYLASNYNDATRNNSENNSYTGGSLNSDSDNDS